MIDIFNRKVNESKYDFDLNYNFYICDILIELLELEFLHLFIHCALIDN